MDCPLGENVDFLVNTCARYYLDFLWLGLAVPKSILDSTSLLTESMTGILVSDKTIVYLKESEETRAHLQIKQKLKYEHSK